MVSMGSAVPPRLAIMVAIVIFCFSFLWSGTSSRSNFAAQAFIPPVGPISGRIVFSSDAFLVLRSSNDETGERATTNHPPPLAFLDDRYADLFRVKKEPTSVWGSILGRLHNRHKPAANSADVKHKYDDQVTPSHLSLRSRSPPVLKLDPETGRYVVQKPTTLPSASASASSTHDVSKPASNATLAQVGMVLKDTDMGVSSESLATAATSTELNNVTQENVIAHHSSVSKEDTADDIIISTADNSTSSTTSSGPPLTSHHEGASPESSSPQLSTSIVLRDNANDGHQESKGESHEQQIAQGPWITADLLDVVGKAFAGESSTDEDGRIATATVGTSSLARNDNTHMNGTTKVESDSSHQQSNIAAQDLVHPDNEDDTSKLPGAPSVADNDNKSPEDTKIPIATLASTADPDNSGESLLISSAVTKDSAASPTPEEDVPQLAVTSSLEGQHPTTLSEQGVRVVKSAAEAATKIAFFVGKAALTLAVAVAKAALALDEEKNIAGPAPKIGVDELDRDATEALEMAENALSRSSDQGRSALFGSQRSRGREAKRAKDFFFGLFGWLNIAKLAEMASPTGQATASTSTTVIMPHPPSPPSTLEALQTLEASLSKEILASVDYVPSRDQLHQDEKKEEETKPIMEIEISEKARKRQITSIEISSAIKKARDAAAKASREAEELESMLLSLGK